MDTVFIKVLNMSYIAAWVILFVLLARLLLRKAPKRYSYMLWLIPLLRLICPFSFESVLSLIPVKAQAIPSSITFTQTPKIDSGIPIVNSAVNSMLPPAAPAASINPMQIWLGIGEIVWIVGIAALLIYSLVSLFFLRRSLAVAMPMRGNILLVDHIKTPFVIGLIHPKIYLPSSLSEKEQGYIILHEQTHIRRGDHIIKLLAFLTLCIHWFNPLAWAAFILSSKDMEMSCDESVIKHTREDIRQEYSASLLSLATGRRIIAGVPLAFGEGNTEGRIKNLLNYKKPAFWVSIVAVIAVAALAVCLLTNPKAKIGGEIYENGSAAISVIDSGTDYAGVGISLHSWDLDAAPSMLAVDWKNDSQYNIIYGDHYHIYKLENGKWVSCAYEKEVVFHDIAYSLAASDTQVKNYKNYSFDLSKTGIYKLETDFFFEKDIPITEDEHHKVWIEFEIGKKASDLDAQTLYALKTPYIGNNSAVGAIPKALGAAEIGSYTFELQTDAEPYGITINFENNSAGYSEEQLNEKMMHCSWLFLALVDNAEIFTWTYPNETGGFDTHSATVEAVSKTIGDIKQFGTSQKEFERLLSLISDSPALTHAASSGLEGAVSQAILSENYEAHDPGVLRCEAHTTLKTVEDGNTVRVYAIALYKMFGYSDGRLVSEPAGAHTPVSISFEKNGNDYVMTEYWMPMDGSKYQSSICEKFPDDIEDAAMDLQSYIYAHTRACYAQAVDYWKVDTDAVLKSLIDTICSSPAQASDPKAYIDEHYIEYREMLFYGDYALRYCFSRFEQGGETGLDGHIMARACREIMSYYGETAALEGNFATGQDWYQALRTYALKFKDQFNDDEISQNYPVSWILLQALDG